MAVQTVFSSNLDPSLENLTARFTNATGFYILAPFLNAELEIDVFLQVYFPTALGEQVRNLPLGKIEEQAIKLNITDTQSLVTIPSEYLGSGLEMALLFLASSTTFLQVVVISPECTLCQLKTQIETVDNRLNDIESTLQQILTAVNEPSAPVVVAGTTPQQQFFFIQ